jgi:hypothetical protein
MPSIDIDQIIRIVSRNTGWDYTRVQALGEALAGSQNAPGLDGVFNPDFRGPYVAMLLLALASGADATNAKAKAAQYYHLQSDDPQMPPEAGELLESFLVTFFHREVTGFAKAAFRSEVEVCTTTPAVRLLLHGTDGLADTHYTEADADSAPSWDSDYVRHGCTLPGRVLFRVACDIRQLTMAGAA